MLSIREFGWQQPIVAAPDGTILAGHTRYMAAKNLNCDSVPVLYADNLTPDQAKAFIIADNRTHDFTTWDYGELALLLEDLSEDYSELLGLADWEQVISDLEAELDTETGGGALDLSNRSKADLSGVAPELTVVCENKTARAQVAAIIAELDGVLNVREKRSK